MFRHFLNLLLNHFYFNANVSKNEKEINVESEDFDETTLIYYISLVGSDAEVYKSNVKNKMDYKKDGNMLPSCQHLLKFNKNTGRNGEDMNVLT